jgi:site-specific DNA recombinase
VSKRAVLYSRVSYDDRGNDALNLQGQLEMCRKYALERSYTIVDELPEDERGARGADFNLPKLNRALEMARSGEFDVLVVRELDRFARRLAKQLIVEEEFKRAGVEVEYVLGEYPDTPEGNLNKNIRAVIAEYEALKIAERMKRGRRLIVKGGSIMLHGNRPPYGYRVSGDGKNLRIHDPEARIVRSIFTWYIEGDETGRRLSTRKIAAKLTGMRIPTWADVHGTYKKCGYGEWSWSFIRDVLRCETYKGDWHYGRYNHAAGRTNPRSHWLTIKVPAIVSLEVWEGAQVQRKINTTESRRNVKREYLLRYRLRCGECGSTLCGQSVTSGGKVYQYYRCNGYLGNVTNVECSAPGFRVDQVDSSVWEWVREKLLNPARLENGLLEYQAKQEQEHAPLRARLSAVRGLIADHQAQLERLVDLYLSGDFPRERLMDRKARLEETIEALEREQAGLTTVLKARMLTRSQVQTIQEFAAEIANTLDIADASFEARRRVIEMVNVQATLAVEGEEKVVHVRGCLGKDDLSFEKTTTQSRTPANITRWSGRRRRSTNGCPATARPSPSARRTGAKSSGSALVDTRRNIA